MEMMQRTELSPQERSSRLVVTPHPLTLQGQTSVVVVMEQGDTLLSVLAQTQVDDSWVVELDGIQVPSLMWGRTRVKHGVVIECRRLLHDEGTLRVVAFAVLAYYTMGAGNAWLVGAGSLTAATGLTASLIGAVAFYAGAQLLNSVLPPPKPAQVDMATNNVSPTYSLSGGRNSARLWEPMSLVLGQPYCVPDMAGQPWTHFAGEDQYLTQIFHAGLNVHRIDSLRIGQTPLGFFQGVSISAQGLAENPWSVGLPANSVDTIAGAYMASSDEGGAWVTRTTSANTIKIGIDLEMTMFRVDSSNGAYLSSSVFIRAFYRRLGSSTWIGVPTGTTYDEEYIASYETDTEGNSVPVYATRTLPYEDGHGAFHSASSKPLRVSLEVPVTSGQYEVRLRNNTFVYRSSSQQNSLTWTQLKSFQPDLASYPGQTLVALSIKASGQLTGSLDQLNWVATAKPAPYWNGAAWVTATNKTNGLSNPGTQLLQLARGLYDEDGKLIAGLGWPDSRIDIESLKSFMVWCSANEFRFDAIIQQSMSIGELMDAVAYAGMGSITWAGGKFGVQWLANDAPVEGVINMGNIKAKSFSVTYASSDRADEIEYGYFDAAENNSWNSLRVQSPEVDVPINTARLSNIGITSERHAAILARHAMAQNIYMSKAITFEQDLEYLTYRRGSVLALSHDLTQWGYSGRVQSVAVNGGVISLALDDAIPAPSTGNAFIGLRLVGETQYRIFKVSPFTGSARSVSLVGAWPSGVPLPGDSGQPMDALWIYDFKSTPGQKVVVTKVEPSESQGGAKVTVAPLVDGFWLYVLLGSYVASPTRSLLSLAATVQEAHVYEELQRQGNTYYVDLTCQFTVSGQYKSAEIWGGVNDGPLSLLGAVDGVSFSWRGGLAQTWRLEVRPKNSLGQFGVVKQLTYEVLGLSKAPSDVEGLNVSIGADGLRVAWKKCPDLDYSSTAVRMGASWDSTVDLINETSISSLIGWVPEGLIKLHAKHYDTTGNESLHAASASIQIQPPALVRIVRSDVQVNTVALGWDDAKTSQPIKSYAIYTGLGGASFADCMLYGKAGSDSRSDVVIFRSAGSKRIYLVAEDVAGNLSTPSSLDVNVSLPTNFVLSSEWDANWSGTKVNAYVDANALFLPVLLDETWDQHFALQDWLNTDAQVDAGYPLAFQPSAVVGSYTEQHDIGKLIPSGKISVTVQSTTLSGSVVPSVLIEWSADASTWLSGAQGSTDVQATQIRYVRVTYSVTAQAGDDLVKIQRVHVSVSSEEKAEFAHMDLLASDVNGTPYTTTKGFFDVVTAAFTPVATALGGTSPIARWSVYIDDAASPATPAKVYVMAWDASDNRVSASGALQIGGY